MGGPSTSSTTTTAIPKPDTIVPYVAYGDEPNGALYVFGDPSSSKMALLCAGFPDDHTVLLPFAKALSETQGGTKNSILVGVMCLPGYDDRPEDGVPWESHPPDGFSFDRCERAVREASKALRKVSTHDCPDFTGIFHDWGAIVGSLWAQRVEVEARDTPGAVLKPNKIVFFDVLNGPSPTMQGLIKESDCKVPGPTLHQMMVHAYMGVHAMSFWISRYLSRHLAAAVGTFCLALMFLLGLYPVYLPDARSRADLYGQKQMGLHRMTYMSFMYSRMITDFLRSPSLSYSPGQLHEDWKEMPILFLFGTEKRTIFHSSVSLDMLQREEKEKRSLSKAVAIEGAGHWMYLQKQDECLKYVLEFMNAKNTFVS